MTEIICPHCKKAFTVDESGYAAILQQVRNKEFDSEIHARLVAYEQEKNAVLRRVKAESELTSQKILSEKEEQSDDAEDVR